MNLHALIESYSLERGVTESTVDQLIYAVKRLEHFLGRPATIEDLNSDTLNRWLKDMAGAERYAIATINSTRGAIIGLWSFAHVIGESQSSPSRVRRLKRPDTTTRAWTKEELSRLIAAASQLPADRYLPNGVQYRTYFATLIELAYYTGLPRADLMSITAAEFSRRPEDQSAKLVHIRCKTGGVMVGSAPEEVFDRFLAMQFRIRKDGHSGWETPLKWPRSWRMLYIWMERIKKDAGVPTDGALHKIRRSGATHVLMDGREPSFYLNHSDPRLARRHYVDRLQLNDSISPRRLDKPEAG